VTSKKAKRWARHLTEFEAHLRAQEPSPLTQRNYRDDLVAYAKWHKIATQSPAELERLTYEHLIAWKKHLVKERRLKRGTVNRKLAAMRNFLTWGNMKGHTKLWPFHAPPIVPIDTPAPRWLTRQEENALLRQVDRSASRRHCSRDRAIVTLLLRTGLLVSELASLRWSDIFLSKRAGDLVVHSSNGGVRYRLIPLTKAARDALIPLGGLKLAQRIEDGVRRWGVERAIIQGQRGQMTARGIQGIVEHYARLAGLDVSGGQELSHYRRAT
jgi:integrase/recombinase XerC